MSNRCRKLFFFTFIFILISLPYYLIGQELEPHSSGYIALSFDYESPPTTGDITLSFNYQSPPIEQNIGLSFTCVSPPAEQQIGCSFNYLSPPVQQNIGLSFNYLSPPSQQDIGLSFTCVSPPAEQQIGCSFNYLSPPVQQNIGLSFNYISAPAQQDIGLSFTYVSPPVEQQIGCSFNYQSPPSTGNILFSFNYESPPIEQTIALSFTYVDKSSPSVITNLLAINPTSSTITLIWTSPGDDETLGNIVNGLYQIKHSTYLVDNQVASYYLTWSTDTTPGSIETKIITGLETNTTYYFQVKTADEVLNWSDWSNIASTRTNSSPNIPTTLGPIRFVTGTWGNNNTPTLEFTQVDPDTNDLLKFQIQVSTLYDFSINTVDYISDFCAQGTTNYTLPLLLDGTYYWQVRSIDIYDAHSEWAIANKGNIAFRIDTDSPTISILLAPVDVSYINITTPTFDWSDAVDILSGTSNYIIQIATDEYFNVMSYSGSPVISTAVTDILSEATYYWRVRAKDYAGNYSSWSSTWSVIIDTTPPTMLSTTLTAPNGGETWPAGETRNIMWTATDITDMHLSLVPINIYYSTDSGSNWILIASGELNDGTYAWALPQISCTTCRVNITALDKAGNTASDQSDADFTIGQPNLTVLQTLVAQPQGNPNNPEALRVFADIQNNGLSAAANVLVRFASTNLTPSPNDATIGNLPAGQTSNKFVNFNWPGAGTWNIAITADPNNTIVETNENDNSVAANIVTDANTVISVGDYSSHPAFSNVLITFSEVGVYSLGSWIEIPMIPETVDFAYLHQFNLKENIAFTHLQIAKYDKVKLVISKVQGIKSDTGEIINFELPINELEIIHPFETEERTISEIAIFLNLTTSITETETGWKFIPLLLRTEEEKHSFEILLEPPSEYAIPGSTVTYNIILTNTGTADNTYLLTMLTEIPESWFEYSSSVALKSGQQTIIPLKISVPKGISESRTYPFEVFTTIQRTDPLVIYPSQSVIGKLEVIVDIKPPQTTIEIGEPKWWGARPYVRSDTPWTLNSLDDLIEVGDRVGLGVKYMDYWINSEGHIRQDNPAPSQGAVFSSSWTLTEISPALPEGKHSLYYFAEDILGNIEETKEQKVIIDNTAPTINYHPTKFLYQNDTTVYASLSTKINISAVDPDGNFIHYNFTSQSDDFEVVSGSWTIDTRKGHYIQQDRYVTGYTKSLLKNWRWQERLDKPEYTLQVQVHLSSYISNGFNNTGNFAGGSLIYFRSQDKNNYYALYISERDKQIRVIRQASGMEQELISVDYPVELNRWYDVGLSVSAGTITVNIFGTEVLNISDTHLFDDETIGFGSDNAVVRFADLRITRPALFGEISDASGFKEIRLKQNNQMEQIHQSQPQEISFIDEGLITLEATAQDNLTNICIPVRYTFGVDGTSPETTLNSSENYYQHPSLPEISYAPRRAVYGFESKDRQGKDGIASGIYSTNYRIDSTDSTEPWVVFRATGIYPTFGLSEGRRTLEYYSLDNVQNAEPIHTKNLWVDGTAPQTTLTMTGGVQWTSSDGKLYVSIDTQYILSAQDTVSNNVASGLKDTYYKMDDSPTWTLYTQPITLTEGIRTIHYWSNDNVLNTEQVKSCIVHVDNTAPVTSIEAGQPKCTEHGEPVYDSHPYTVITSNTPITLSAVDTMVENVSSGVQQTNYKIGAGEFTTYTQLFKVAGSDGDYQVQYYSLDNVHNTEQTKSATYTLDNSPPVAEIILPAEENTGLCRIVNGKTAIVGSVSDMHFKWYQLYFTEINTSQWREICQKTYREVRENILTYWDTTGLSEGWYVIKLVAQDCVQNQTTDTVDVYVGRPELALEITGFNKPSYIVLDSTGNIYISDTNNDKVKKYNPQGDLIMTLSGIKSQGSPGRGAVANRTDTFNKPTGVAVDTSGNLYVADGNNDRVIKFSHDSEHLFTLSGFNKPHGLATDTQDNLYVADRNNDRIQKFSPDGTLLMTIDTGVEDDGLNKPQGVIAVDTQNRIYITDRNNDRVLIYSSAGEFITQISSSSGLNKPDGIVVNQQGYIYVSDTNNDVVRKYDRYFNLIATFDGTAKNSQHKFNKPAGVTIDTEGTLYVVDSNNDKMLKYTLPEKPQADTVAGLGVASIKQNDSPTDFKLVDVYAYPNPAKGWINPIFRIETGIADKVDIKVFNIAAELVHSAEISGSSYRIRDNRCFYEYPWDVSNVASGVYIYCVVAEKQGYSPIKVIKKLAVIR